VRADARAWAILHGQCRLGSLDALTSPAAARTSRAELKPRRVLLVGRGEQSVDASRSPHSIASGPRLCVRKQAPAEMASCADLMCSVWRVHSREAQRRAAAAFWADLRGRSRSSSASSSVRALAAVGTRRGTRAVRRAAAAETLRSLGARRSWPRASRCTAASSRRCRRI
jgi:hypothetical protein